MMSEIFPDKIRQIFFPAILIAVLLAASSTLFQLSQSILIINQLGISQLPTLRMFVAIPQVILVISLLIFSMYKPFEMVFRGTLVTLIVLASLLTGLSFFQEEFTHWLFVGLHLLNFPLFSLLIWGFINRLTTSPEGMKYYIPLAFVMGIIGVLVSNVVSRLMAASALPPLSMVLAAIALMVCSLLVFNRAWRNDIHPEGTKIRFPVLSSAYLLAGCVMVNKFLDIVFRSQLKGVIPTSQTYTELMGYFSSTVVISTIIASALWAVIGTWLLLKKGWRVTAMCSSISILSGGVVFLIISNTVAPASWLSQGIFSGLLTGTATTLFFALVQILYLYLPSQSRFTTKVVTEMIALPLLAGIPSLVTQALLTTGPLSSLTPIFNILVLILMILLVFASTRASSKFSSV